MPVAYGQSFSTNHKETIISERIFIIEHYIFELQSWTKVLGQIYICGAFSRAKQTPRR